MPFSDVTEMEEDNSTVLSNENECEPLAIIPLAADVLTCEIMIDGEGEEIASNASSALYDTAELQFEVDIADYNKRALTDIPGEMLERIVTDYPVPEAGYNFGGVCIGNSTATKKPMFRYFKKDLLNKEKFGSWLIWSKKEKGAYCKFCAIFQKKQKRVGRTESNNKWQLVDRPLSDYKDLNQDLLRHQRAAYHTESVAATEAWLRYIELFFL